MRGKYGFWIILVIGLLGAGVFSGERGNVPHWTGNTVFGLVIMLIAALTAAGAEKVAEKLPFEDKRTAHIIVRLGAVVLCALGAIVVFCG